MLQVLFRAKSPIPGHRRGFKRPCPPLPTPQLILSAELESPFSSLYEATENELQGSGMAISKKIEQGPQSHWFRNNRLPSDFNVEVESAVVEVIK
jgi:hypothetical protein